MKWNRFHFEHLQWIYDIVWTGFFFFFEFYFFLRIFCVIFFFISFLVESNSKQTVLYAAEEMNYVIVISCGFFFLSRFDKWFYCALHLLNVSKRKKTSYNVCTYNGSTEWVLSKRKTQLEALKMHAYIKASIWPFSPFPERKKKMFARQQQQTANIRDSVSFHSFSFL